MQKQIIKFFVLLLVLATWFVVLPKLQSVLAGACGSCTKWCVEPYTCTVPGPYGPVTGWCQTSVCCDGNAGSCTVSCTPGYYVCNRPGGCCPIGTEPTPTPGSGGGGGGGSCTRSVWTNAPSCGTNGCDIGWRYQTRTVSPAGCDTTSRCIPDASCDTSTPPPGCTATTWINNQCGGGTCDDDQMEQRRTVTPAGCDDTSQCVANPGCTSGLPTPTPAPTCTISLSPSTLNLTMGGANGTVTATVNCSAPVDNVTFTSGNTTIATVSPATDSSSPYTTSVTPVGVGAVIITGVVSSGGQPIAQDTTTVNSTPPAAWWQAEDADVTTGGDLSSIVPSGETFELVGNGGYPGVPAYAGSTNLTNSNVSSQGWIVRNTMTNARVFDYEALTAQIPASVTSTFNTISAGDNVATRLNSGSATADADNFYWFLYDGSANGGQTLNLNTVNVGSRKVVLLVKDANLNITGNVTLTDGTGFFMVLVDGNISVSSSVGNSGPNLEGIYEADGTFNDGAGSRQLHVRGSVVAYGGINLQRDLAAGNANTPAALFVYAPDQILLYPKTLGLRKISWKEVAP